MLSVESGTVGVLGLVLWSAFSLMLLVEIGSLALDRDIEKGGGGIVMRFVARGVARDVNVLPGVNIVGGSIPVKREPVHVLKRVFISRTCFGIAIRGR